MKVEKWLEFFKNNTNKKLFSLSDLLVMTDEKRSTISVQLSRLSIKGIVENPVRGWYSNPFRPPTPEELSMVIRTPSYLSMEYALSKHSILSQNVFTYTLVTPKLPYTFQNDRDTFEYHQIKRSLFWGYKTEGMVLLAEPEKALLDLIYLRSIRGKDSNESIINSLMDDMYLEDLDRDRLTEYSDKFNSGTKQFVLKLNEEI